MARVIFHIDINAFFASCEENRHPELKGKPVAIGSLSRRSVISTANYKAREYGVHSAMPVYEALRKCPDLELVESDYAYYRSCSRAFFHYLYKYTRAIEPASIDECFMDVTDIIMKYPRPLDLAFQIQQGVYQETGLHVSIGVAPTKFLAKMASDMRKPHGITVLRKAELAQKLWPLPIESMVGIGKRSVPKLQKIGIYTIGDFASPENENKILRILGPSSFSLIQKAQGKSSDRLSYSTTHKSVSISETFENDLYAMDEVLSQARHLTFALSQKMKKENYMGKMISLTMRDIHFHNIVRSQTFREYTNNANIMYEAIRNLIDQNFEEDLGYRHLAIHMGSLKDAKEIIVQPTMFEQPKETTDMILSQLNRQIEGIHLIKASDLLKDPKDA